MGKIVELIESKDKNIRSAKVLIGKTQNVVIRPINRLYPVEFSEEFNPAVQNLVEINECTKARRKAAVAADLKRKFLQQRPGECRKSHLSRYLISKVHVITLSPFVLIFPFYHSLY